MGEDLPSYGFINLVLLNEMKPYLDKAKIPYMEFDAEAKKIPGIKKDVVAPKLILVDKSHVKKVAEIEKGIRIKLGLLIDSKEEMLASLYSLNKAMGEQKGLYTVKGLSEYTARRASALCTHTSAVQALGGDAYSVSVHEKRKKELEKAVITAMIEEMQLSDVIKEKLINVYSQKEKMSDFCEAVAKEDPEISSFYIFSAEDPSKYIQVNGLMTDTPGINYIEGDKTRMSQPIKPVDTFSDRLKIMASLIKTPIVVDLVELNTKYCGNKELIKDLFTVNKEVSVEIAQAVESVMNAAYNVQDTLQINSAVPISLLSVSQIEALNENLINVEMKREPACIPFEYLVKDETGISMEEINKIARDAYMKYVKDENGGYTERTEDNKQIEENVEHDDHDRSDRNAFQL